MNPYQPGEDNQDPYEVGYKAGAASRDAEVARLKTVPMRYRRMAFNAQLQDEVARLEQENDQLRAHINVLREALKFLSYMAQTTGNVMGKDAGLMDGIKAAEQALATPEQPIAEYRNKVIEAFVNEFSRHVGGDGEFWLHELQDFAMKDLAKRVEFQKAARAAEHEERTKMSELERERDTAWAQAHRLALELECLIMDTKDNAVVSKWWDSAFEAIEEYQALKPGADEEAEAWAKMRKVGI